MDEEMGEADFLSLEVDLDYEFEAARFFDFCRAESPAEARAAELWFDSAGSYPPSPFVRILNFGKGVLLENVNTLPKFEDVENTNAITDQSDVCSGPEFSVLDGSSKGLTIPCHKSKDVPQNDRKPFRVGPFSGGSTFMKPTASHLAKQNRPRETKNSNRPMNRFQRPMALKIEKSFVDLPDNGSQAPKRQKIEGGHLCKVAGVAQQADLVHKVPQKKNDPSTCNSHPSRLKITIPREPELQTAQRAQRLRSKNGKDLHEGRIPRTPMFRACPLNRKILGAPSLPLPQKSELKLPQFREFNFKACHRATEHSLAASSSLSTNNLNPSCTVQGGVGGSKAQRQASGNSQVQIYMALSTWKETPEKAVPFAIDFVRPNSLKVVSVSSDKKLKECGNMQVKFKARPLDKKILSSKGDIGIFRSTKREITRPMEFNLSSSKRCQQNPPVELFSKLSLNSEAEKSTTSQANLPWPTHATTKGSKENVINPVQAVLHSIIQINKEESQRHGKNQNQPENIEVSGFRSKASTFRYQEKKIFSYVL